MRGRSLLLALAGVLLLAASATYVLSKKFKFPYTVALVAIGFAVGGVSMAFPATGFLDDLWGLATLGLRGGSGFRNCLGNRFLIYGRSSGFCGGFLGTASGKYQQCQRGDRKFQIHWCPRCCEHTKTAKAAIGLL